MSDEEEEFPETFLLLEATHRIELADLPQSPRKTFRAAEALGWDVHAWLTVGEVAPVLFLYGSLESDANQHNAGDVRFEGYTSNLYAVEARDPQSRAIGFRAHYTGKVYQSGKKSSLGAFDFAMVADPVGVPVQLWAEYVPIRQTRGDFETDKSFAARKGSAAQMADEMDKSYNDHSWYFNQRPFFSSASELDAWMTEWKGFTK